MPEAPALRRFAALLLPLAFLLQIIAPASGARTAAERTARSVRSLNTISLLWSAPRREVRLATSSVTLQRGRRDASLQTGLTDQDDRLQAVLAVANTSGGTLVLRGTLIGKMRSADGLVTRSIRKRVEVRLGRGEVLRHSFTFHVPTGSYLLTGRFRAA